MGVKSVINHGWAYGKVLVHHNIIDVSLVKKDKAETAIFKQAVDNCIAELLDVKENLPADIFSDYSFVDAHLMLLQDPVLINEIISLIELEQCNAEYAIATVIDKYLCIIKDAEDDYLKARSLDLADVKKRLLTNVSETELAAEIKEETILVVDELYPSQVVNLNPLIKGIIAFTGSDVSHSAILCKAYDIPYVIATKEEYPDYLLIDGEKLIFTPTEKQITLSRKRTMELACANRVPFVLSANVCHQNELTRVKKMGFCGIGLLRTEMLFLAKNRLLNQTEQRDIYREASQICFPNKVIIRTFDIGDDKQIPFMPASQKGIQIYTQYRLAFLEQVQAIVSANALGNIQIMFPMIETDEEFQRLRADVLSYAKDIKIGMMVETIKAIENISTFENVDFISIGTNDLLKELYGFSRQSGSFDYRQYQDNLLARLRNVVEYAQGRKIELSICGELAGDPQFVGLMRSIGINHFSVSISAAKKLCLD